MTDSIRRTFRSCDYEFFVAPSADADADPSVRLIHSRNVTTGFEAAYAGTGAVWKRRTWGNGQGSVDFVRDPELIALLCEVATEACPS